MAGCEALVRMDAIPDFVQETLLINELSRLKATIARELFHIIAIMINSFCPVWRGLCVPGWRVSTMWST